MDSLKDRLEAAMRARGLSGRALAKKAGLRGASHVNQIRSGWVKEPRHKIIAAIADALEVNVVWLEDGKGPRDLARTVYDDPLPARGALLSMYRASQDPHMRAAVTELAATSYGDGRAEWTIEQWNKELFRVLDEKRRIALDPKILQTMKDAAASAADSEDSTERDAMIEQAHRIKREKADAEAARMRNANKPKGTK